MPERVYRLVVAEDEQIILEDIVNEIRRADAGFEIVGTAFNGKDALDIIKALNPDVLFTDIRMPIMNGLELMKQARIYNPELYVVIISGFDDFSYAQKALTYGAKNYLLKPLDPEELINALERARDSMDRLLAPQLPARPEPRDAIAEVQAQAMDIHERVVQVEKYIRDHYFEEINYEELSRSYYFNGTYLTRVFKKQFGCSPNRYQINLRINEAKRLIRSHPNLELSKIGEMVGYHDSHYFSRIFKAETGKSPSEFREGQM